MSRAASTLMDWDGFLGRLVHPTQIAIIEGLRWIDQPLSAAELTEVFEETLGLAAISYHVRRLRDLGVLELIKKREVRGATERFYFFAGAKKTAVAKRAWR